MSTVQVSGPSFTANQLLKALHMLTDKITYQKITSRKCFKLPQEGQAFTWMEVVAVMEGAENDICDYDVVMDDLKTFGASFDKSAIEKNMKKTSALKQNWIKALPVADHFYQRYDEKDVFSKMVNIQLELLMKKIGRTEVVTLRCPKVQLEELMQDVKLKMKEDRSTRAVEYMKKTRRGLKEMRTIEMNLHVQKTIFGDMSDHALKETIMALECISKKDIKILTKKLLFMAHKAQRFVEELVECDKIGIARRFDKVPAVRSVRNDTIVFVEELRFAFEVACQLEGRDKNIDLPIDDDNTFNYIARNQVEELSKKLGFTKIPFEIVPLDEIKFKGRVDIPLLSPKNTRCMEAGAMPKFGAMAENLKYYQVDQMTMLVKKVCEYINPERGTFCMDEETCKRFEKENSAMMVEGEDNTFNGKAKSIKELVDRETKKRNFASFEVILSTLLSPYQWVPIKEQVERIIECADFYTLFFEYPELSIVYHNQQKCKNHFCPITLIEEGEDVGFEIPQKCAGPVNEHVKQIMKMMKDKNVTRMSKPADEDDKEEDREEMNQLKEDNAVRKEELSLLKNQCEELKAVGEKMKKEVGDRRKVEMLLKKETDQLREQFHSNQSTISLNKEQHATNMRELKEKSEKAKKEMEVWKMKFQMGNPTDISLSVKQEFTIGFYLDIITNTRKQLASSKAQLQNFLSVSNSTTDKKRAEREYKVFEWDANVVIEKAEENVVILTKDPECPVEELMKIQKLSSVFSRMTMVKMEEATNAGGKDCFICLDEMCNTSKLFNCIVCSAQCHQSCYQTWAASNTSCPLCRQSFPDSNEFPAL